MAISFRSTATTNFSSLTDLQKEDIAVQTLFSISKTKKKEELLVKAVTAFKNSLVQSPVWVQTEFTRFITAYLRAANVYDQKFIEENRDKILRQEGCPAYSDMKTGQVVYYKSLLTGIEVGVFEEFKILEK